MADSVEFWWEKRIAPDWRPELTPFELSNNMVGQLNKSEVVHYNSKSVSPLQNPFTYDGVVLRSREGQVQIFGHAA